MSLSSQKYAIDPNNIGFILSILRDKLYTNKPLAVVREYVSNAIDAHIEAGISDTPIDVTIPTGHEEDDPYFIVRDYGLGIHPEQMDRVFRMLGSSTKRDNKDAIGENGIGAKCAFALSDYFKIISYYKGKKYTYNSYIEEGRNPLNKLDLMSVENTTETGLEVIIPIDNNLDSFRTEAIKFFTYLESPVPINHDLNLPIKCLLLKRGICEIQKIKNISNSNIYILIKGCPYIYQSNNLSSPRDNLIIKGDKFAPGIFNIGPGREYIDINPTANKILYRLINIFNRQVVSTPAIVGRTLEETVNLSLLFRNYYCRWESRYINLETYKDLVKYEGVVFNDLDTDKKVSITRYINNRGYEGKYIALTKKTEQYLKANNLESMLNLIPVSEIIKLPIINKSATTKVKSPTDKVFYNHVYNLKTNRGENIPRLAKEERVYQLKEVVSISINRTGILNPYITDKLKYYLDLSIYNMRRYPSVKNTPNWISVEDYVQLILKELPNYVVEALELAKFLYTEPKLYKHIHDLFEGDNLVALSYKLKSEYFLVDNIKADGSYLNKLLGKFPIKLLRTYETFTQQEKNDIKEIIIKAKQ